MTHPTACPVCGGNVAIVTEPTELRQGSRRAVIDVEHFRCADCGEVFYTAEQADAAQRALAVRLREEDGLLTPEQIRAVREKYGLSQAQFEKLLSVGDKTVVRWERGTVFQNKATDQLIRTISEVPEAFAFLAQRNGVAVAAVATPAPAAPAKFLHFRLPRGRVATRQSVLPVRDRIEPFVARTRPAIIGAPTLKGAAVEMPRVSVGDMR